MKTFKSIVAVLVIACTSLLISCSSTGTSAKHSSKAGLYVCGCAEDCKCNVASIKPGKCGCGHELIAGHVKKVEEGTAFLCMCNPDCKCAANPNDPTKCGCGKPLRKASLEGTGIYFCDCGGSCCGTVSDQPGQCKCGKPLKKAD